MSDNKQDDMFPCESRVNTPEFRKGYDDVEWKRPERARKAYSDLVGWERGSKGKDDK